MAILQRLERFASAPSDRATLLGQDHPVVAGLLNDLANSFVLQGEYAAARTLYEQALGVYQRRLGEASTLTTTVVYNLAIVNSELGDFLESKRQFEFVIATWARVLSPDHPYVARGRSALADMLKMQGLYSDAKINYERALAIRERTLAKNHRDVARTLTMLATTEASLGHLQTALELSTRAVTIWEQSDERDTRRATDALVVHGGLQAAQGDYVAARESQERALAIADASSAPPIRGVRSAGRPG